MIKILIVDDSPTARKVLTDILQSDPELVVIGSCSNGPDAINFIKDIKPDMITMDIHMPGIDGYETTKKIMELYPVPIIIVSASYAPNEINKLFRCIEAGAVAFVEKPLPDNSKITSNGTGIKLIETIKNMSQVHILKKNYHINNHCNTSSNKGYKNIPYLHEIQAVVIGASTGGPLVIKKILSSIPKDYPVPLLIVQHISLGFVKWMANWLTESTQFPVQVAQEHDLIKPGNAYLAPDNCHMGINVKHQIILDNSAPENGLRPSVSYLFRSAAEVFGKNVAAVLLTGMGKDGARELKLLYDKGAVTVIQNQETSIVFGMPGEAFRLNAATYVLSPDGIIDILTEIAKQIKT